jgi:hypothetical protein
MSELDIKKVSIISLALERERVSESDGFPSPHMQQEHSPPPLFSGKNGKMNVVFVGGGREKIQSQIRGRIKLR